MATRFLERHATAAYFLMTFAISWIAIYIVIGGNLNLSETVGKDDPRFPFVYLAMLAGPVTAGLGMTAVVGGRAGLVRLWSRFTSWRASGSAWAMALLTAPIVVLGVPALLSLRWPAFTPAIFSQPDLASTLLFGLVIGLGAGVFEELGWTGFAAPRLIERRGSLATGLLIGLPWAFWHAFAMAWGLGSLNGPIPPALFLAVDLVTILPAYRVLMILLYAKTPSLPLAMLMHASLTSSLLILSPAGLTGGRVIMHDAGIAIAFWTIACVIGLARRRSGYPAPSARLRPA